jgi:putative cobalt transporter subunit CbtA
MLGLAVLYCVVSRVCRRSIAQRTTPATPAAFPAIEAAVREFRRLFLVAVASGTLAGLLSFGAQYSGVIPLIQTAEKFEAAHEAHSYHEEE